MVDFAKVERKWQERWQKAHIFEPKIESKKKKFFFTVPYPYISGPLHIGHGRVVIEGDVYTRYRRMAGDNVLFPLAFHITGTPILGISAAIAAGDHKKIDLYRNYVSNYVKDKNEVHKIIESFKEPWNIVNFFIPKVKAEFAALGPGIDWTRSFTSGDIEHQKMVEWQFHKYKEKGYLSQGNYPVLYCENDKNAVGEDDIQDGDSNPVEKQEFTLLKFKRTDGSFLVAGTLRPETVFGQTNLWIIPDKEFVRLKVGKEEWIISREGADKIAKQKKDVKIVGKVKTNEMIGEHVVAPMIKKEIIVLPSRFIDTDMVSGIVTSVPSDAPYDYIALEDLKKDAATIAKYKLNADVIKKIEPIMIIDTQEYGNFAAKKVCEELGIKNQDDIKLEEATQKVYKAGYHTGKMIKNCGEYNGKSVIDAKETIKKKMIEAKEADVFYETSRHANCRCSGKIIVAVLGNQWFLNFNAPGWKEKARECLKSIELVPEHYRKQFEDTFEWLDKRPVARRRGIGTKFPFDKEWVIESLSDSTIYMSLYTIKNLIEKYGVEGDSLTAEFFDYVYLGKGKPAEVSKKCGVKPKVLEEMHENFDYWYPNDHRHTFVNHLSNHLSFFIFAHAAIFPKNFWPKKISFHGLIFSEGEKMSKSKGNVVSLLDIKNRFGADPFRAYLMTTTSIEGSFDWRTEEVLKMQNALKQLFNLVVSAKPGKTAELSTSSKAFLSKFESLVKYATESISQMRTREYANTVIYSIANEYKKLQTRVSEKELKAVNAKIMDKWIALLAPVVPHIAEELWEEASNEGFVSTAEWPSCDEKLINKELEFGEELISNTAADISEIEKLVGKKPEKIMIFVAEEWKNDMLKTIKKMIDDGKRDFKTIIEVLMKDEKIRPHGGDVTRTLPKILKDAGKIPEIMVGSKKEMEILEDAKDFFKKEFNCRVEIHHAEKSSEQKARQAMPGKPAILFS